MARRAAALLLLAFGAFGSWWIVTHHFKDVGAWWRGRVRDQFVETTAAVERVDVAEYRYSGKSASDSIHEWRVFAACGYRAGDRDLRASIQLKAFPFVEHDNAERFARHYRQQFAAVALWYDPKNPTFAVLDKDDIPGLFEVVFMSFLSSVILITVAALGAMGFAGLLPERMFTRRAKRLVRRPLTPPPAPAPDVSREGKAPPRPSGPLTGNDLEDYYSGAIKAHARGYWSGFWCDIFLLEDRVVVVHDESHHHWVRSFTIREALAPEVVNDLFVDNGQYPPNAEVTRTRKDYEATLTRN